MTDWVPDCGDVVWLNVTPQAGHEQAGHRPALVLSPASYNSKAGMMLCCPITTKIKGYPFEVPISCNPASVVLADQIHSLDWRARSARKKDQLAAGELEAVRRLVRLLVG